LGSGGNNRHMSPEDPERSRREQLMHELRTPLSVVKGSLESLLTHWDHIEEGRREQMMSRALTNIEDLASAIDQAEGPGRPEERPEESPEEEGPIPRVLLTGIEVARSRHEFTVSVRLNAAGRSLTGEGRATMGRWTERQAVVLAVLGALGDVVRPAAELEGIAVLDVGGDRMAVVVLRRHSTPLVGAALLHLDEPDAICRATLDALNRVLATAR
jgi:signal transduction histidine kinase